MIAWDRVAELRREVGEGEFDEVVGMFLREVEEVLGRLRSAPAAQTLEDDLHFVKGSALTLGFSELSALCLAGERQAAAQRFDRIELGLVQAAFEASKSEFLAGLSTH